MLVCKILQKNNSLFIDKERKSSHFHIFKIAANYAGNLEAGFQQVPFCSFLFFFLFRNFHNIVKQQQLKISNEKNSLYKISKKSFYYRNYISHTLL